MFQIFGIAQPNQAQPNSLLSRIWDPNRTSEVLGLTVSRILIFSIIGAGLFFFVRLISAGYSMLTSLGDPAKIQGATKELTNAVIGLLIAISAFFIAQILETVFGIKILTI